MNRNLRNVLRMIAFVVAILIGFWLVPGGADSLFWFLSEDWYVLVGYASITLILLAVVFYYEWERERVYTVDEFRHRFVDSSQQLLEGLAKRLEHKGWTYKHTSSGWDVYVYLREHVGLGRFHQSVARWLVGWAQTRVRLKAVDGGVKVIAPSSFLKDFAPAWKEGKIQ